MQNYNVPTGLFRAARGLIPGLSRSALRSDFFGDFHTTGGDMGSGDRGDHRPGIRKLFLPLKDDVDSAHARGYALKILDWYVEDPAIRRIMGEDIGWRGYRSSRGIPGDARVRPTHSDLNKQHGCHERPADSETLPFQPRKGPNFPAPAESDLPGKYRVVTNAWAEIPKRRKRQSPRFSEWLRLGMPTGPLRPTRQLWRYPGKGSIPPDIRFSEWLDAGMPGGPERPVDQSPEVEAQVPRVWRYLGKGSVAPHAEKHRHNLWNYLDADSLPGRVVYWKIYRDPVGFLTWGEIAQRLRVTEKKAQSAYKRGLATLRKRAPHLVDAWRRYGRYRFKPAGLTPQKSLPGDEWRALWAAVYVARLLFDPAARSDPTRMKCVATHGPEKKPPEIEYPTPALEPVSLQSMNSRAPRGGRIRGGSACVPARRPFPHPGREISRVVSSSTDSQVFSSPTSEVHPPIMDQVLTIGAVAERVGCENWKSAAQSRNSRGTLATTACS